MLGHAQYSSIVVSSRLWFILALFFCRERVAVSTGICQNATAAGIEAADSFNAFDIGNGSKFERGERGRNFVRSQQICINDYGIAILSKPFWKKNTSFIRHFDFHKYLEKYDWEWNIKMSTTITSIKLELSHCQGQLRKRNWKIPRE